jgi:long-chain acyl-CoA synthetase
LAKIIKDTPTVRLVVYDGVADPAVLEDLKRNAGDRDGGFKVVTLDEVEKLGRENPKEPIKADKDDVFCCMYTSGSSESCPPRRVVWQEAIGMTDRLRQ